MPKKDKRRVFRSRLALRDMRLRAGLTEQALAAQLGVTYHRTINLRALDLLERATMEGRSFTALDRPSHFYLASRVVDLLLGCRCRAKAGDG
jgi:hypothetical protein